MDSIEKLNSAEHFPEFSRRVRVACNERYPRFRPWEEWLESVDHQPTEGEVAFWAATGGDHSEAELLGRDVWSIMALKIGTGPLGSIIDRTSLEPAFGPVSSLTRASRAWYLLIQESGGDVRDRRMKLWERVMTPTQVSLAEVGTAVRAWENDISVLEQMGRTRVDPGMKYHSLLKILPTSLQKLARSQ